MGLLRRHRTLNHLSPGIFGKLLDITWFLKNEDFYAKFITSEVYRKFYKDDDAFEPVGRFLEGALNRDFKKRETALA